MGKRKGKCDHREDYIHCEVEGGVINIHEGLHNTKGQKVTSISISPDDSYSGERIWKTVPKTHGVRLVQLKKRAP